MSVLEIDAVTMRFGGVTAVDNVSLKLEENELLGFIGPNGAGKTTLMRIITGVLRPQSGRVLLRGADISNWSVERRVHGGIALAQQIVRPLKALSVVDNIALACGTQRMLGPLSSMFQISKEKERAKGRDLLRLVDIEDAADSMPSELPLGYLKRLELARALALQPTVLLLDEPLAGLNQQEARDMADLIKSLAGQDRSVLLIEHNIREVSRICPTLYVQDNGRALLKGAVGEVMRSPELHRAYLGTSVDTAC